MRCSSIDLHMHSWYSGDGEYQPEDLVQMCLRQGIRVMSITDHNCIKANARAAKCADEAGIIYVPGIEIDCTHQGVNFHVLGYGMDLMDPFYEYIEHNEMEQSRASASFMLDATKKLGFDITAEEMQQLDQGRYCTGCWTGEMFAEVLLNNPSMKDHPLLKPYRSGGLRSDNPYVNFYWDYYSQGKPCYAEIHYPAVSEVIDRIHSSRGTAVLAHPGINLRGHEVMLDGMLALGLDGIEAYSSYHSMETAANYAEAAEKAERMITCGSDFHGKTKPSISLGGTGLAVSENLILKGLHQHSLIHLNQI
ncbi:MAG: PHP domain-containing protein [Erysipelotrichia bacterium]|nr:PHP domain-containing protein [Erysipelotrichia bacterium]